MSDDLSARRPALDEVEDSHEKLVCNYGIAVNESASPVTSMPFVAMEVFYYGKGNHGSRNNVKCGEEPAGGRIVQNF
ncbi:hypothetical protein HNQ56_001455 [Anaerotaenia torta]